MWAHVRIVGILDLLELSLPRLRPSGDLALDKVQFGPRLERPRMDKSQG